DARGAPFIRRARRAGRPRPRPAAVLLAAGAARARCAGAGLAGALGGFGGHDVGGPPAAVAKEGLDALEIFEQHLDLAGVGGALAGLEVGVALGGDAHAEALAEVGIFGE